MEKVGPAFVDLRLHTFNFTPTRKGWHVISLFGIKNGGDISTLYFPEIAIEIGRNKNFSTLTNASFLLQGSTLSILAADDY